MQGPLSRWSHNFNYFGASRSWKIQSVQFPQCENSQNEIVLKSFWRIPKLVRRVIDTWPTHSRHKKLAALGIFFTKLFLTVCTCLTTCHDLSMSMATVRLETNKDSWLYKSRAISLSLLQFIHATVSVGFDILDCCRCMD